MGAQTRCRIRPPGCLDESKWGWKTFTVAEVAVATAAVAAPAAAATATAAVATPSQPAAAAAAAGERVFDMSPGDFEKYKTVPYEGHSVEVRRKQVKGVPGLEGLEMHAVELELDAAAAASAATPKAVALRWCLPALTREAHAAHVKKDAEAALPADGQLTREVRYPFLMEPRVYHLRASVTEDGGDCAVLRLHTDPAAVAAAGADEVEGVFLHQEVTVRRMHKGYTVRVAEVHCLGSGMPKEQMNFFCAEFLARIALRLSGSGALMEKVDHDPLLGSIASSPENRSVVEGLLQEFSTECDCGGFAFYKDVWVGKLDAYVKVYRKPAGPGQAYDAFRAEHELKNMDAEDMCSVLEHIKEPGSAVKKALTPECETQGVHVEEGVARVAFKIDKLGPWPLKKREFLLLSILGWDRHGTLFFPQRSIEDKRFPPNAGNCVALFHNVGYRVRKSEKPGRVHVMQLVHADPGGLPTRVYDLAMVDKVQNLGHIQELVNTKDKWVTVKGGVPIKTARKYMRN